MEKPFVHLHLHTEYSLLDGVAKIAPLLEKVKAQGMTACAITDHGVMYGVYEFWSTARAMGIKPLLGCEVYVAKRSRFDKTAGIDNERYHLTLFAKNFEGYQNLLKIVSLAHTEGFYYKPRADKELLQKYGKGIIALSGCLSSNFNRLLLANQKQKAKTWLKFLTESFDNVFVEIQRNGVKDSEDLIPLQLEIAKEMKLKVVATCDTHYIEPADFKIQEIAWCISDGKKLTDPDRRRYYSREFFLKGPEEMYKLYEDMPEVVANTQKVADLVEDYGIEFQRIQPKFDTAASPETTKDLLREHTYAGAKTRYPDLTEEIIKRIDYELEVIDQKGYNNYFLVVEDYIKWARSQGILVGPGRGSGAGSVAAYCLGITDLDPLRWELLFERFLNPERQSPPDFDIDFQDDRRDELFEYMSQKYGRDKTSFIGTFGRLKTKAAIRDVARVMGIDLSIADKLSKMVIVKFGKVYPIVKMREEVTEFDEMIKSSAQLTELAGYVGKLENLARHVSIHACGYLVTPKPITDYVPVQLESRGGNKVVTQVEGHNLEPLGLMKFDFLGLSNLTVISNTARQIKYTTGKVLDITVIPLDDPKTFKLFQEGHTTGVFQFESEGMKKYLRDLKPTEMEDLIFLNAAYRPGPMQYIPSYIARKYGKEEVKYLDRVLEPILKTTYGYAIYQEQVINIAVKFAGYSLGEADMLRRAMGKKKHDVMEKEKVKFIDMAKKNGHTQKLAEEVFSYLEPFADYGFNRSHSACYSLIAYQTAYLKANYPLEFIAGLMETDINSSDKLERDLQEARDMGLKVLAPDVNKSYFTFSIEDGKAIRFGLGGIKGGGEKGMKAIVEARLKAGEFKNMYDLIVRVGTSNISKKDLECLIKVGALDKFGNRNQLIAAVPQFFELASQKEKSLQGGQVQLFSLLGEETDSEEELEVTLPFVDKETEYERLNWEKELLGAYISKHPLENHKQLFITDDVIPLKKLSGMDDRTRVLTLALISRIKIIYSKKDSKPMAFLELSDTDHKMEAVVFTKTYEKVSTKLIQNLPFVVIGSVNYREEALSIIIEDILTVEEFNPKSEIIIDIRNERDKSKLEHLKKTITLNPGNYKLKIIYGDQMHKKEIVREIDPRPEVVEILNQYRLNG